MVIFECDFWRIVKIIQSDNESVYQYEIKDKQGWYFYLVIPKPMGEWIENKTMEEGCHE